MRKAVFVTGTDTGVGKTLVTGLLAGFMAQRGLKVATQKWVQTGCSGYSEDVLSHIDRMGKTKADFADHLDDMSPYVFGFAASPHLAARMENKMIEPSVIESSFRRLEKTFDFVVVEGAGGMMVPLDDDTTIADTVARLGLSVLIVVENKLGAINQCLLTVEAARKRGIDVVGIIFNRLSHSGDERVLKDNPYIINKLTRAEVMGELPFSKDPTVLHDAFKHIGPNVLRGL
jgi:dethiobiotin synthetase